MYGVRVYRAQQQRSQQDTGSCAPPPPRPTLLCIHAAWSRVVLNDCARISRNQAPAQHCSFGREETECWAAAAHNFHVRVRCLNLNLGPAPRAGRAALTRHMLSPGPAWTLPVRGVLRHLKAYINTTIIRGSGHLRAGNHLPGARHGWRVV